jgi:GAF domain-containing protein
MTDEEPEAQPTDDPNADAQIGRALRRLLTTFDGAAALQPHEGRSDLLRTVVETAARMVAAGAASLFLLDESGTQLVFEVAIGPKADEASKFTVPLGVGIAGTVAATGQPIAISAPEQDPRFASEIAQSIGHIPQSILCVPMRYGDTIVGVLEVLDKTGRDTFTASDIEVLSYFAGIASLATEQIRRQDDLRAALVEILASWASGSEEAGFERQVVDGIDAVLRGTRSSPEYRLTLETAALISEIADSGQAERELCYDWLRTLQRYLHARQMPFSVSGFPWSR